MSNEELTQKLKEEYERGFIDGLNTKHSVITLDDESMLPVDFIDYSSAEEKEMIGLIVQSPEYQQFFRKNMMNQVISRWRQARLSIRDPEKMKTLTNVGNSILDLILFYDESAEKVDRSDEPAAHGYDSSF